MRVKGWLLLASLSLVLFLIGNFLSREYKHIYYNEILLYHFWLNAITLYVATNTRIQPAVIETTFLLGAVVTHLLLTLIGVLAVFWLINTDPVLALLNYAATYILYSVLVFWYILYILRPQK